MFAPLRTKELNPESWNSKIQFWSSLIVRWSQHNNHPVVNLDQLEAAFEREGRTPNCLEAVLQEMWSASQLVDLARYLGALQPRATWASWLRGVGVTAMQTVGESIAGFRPNDDMVVPEVADRLCGEALWQLRRAKPALALRQCMFLPEAELKAVVSTGGFVLEFLTAKRQIVSQVVDGQTFYKISTVDETVSFDETDEGILRLNLTLGRLNGEIAGIEGEIKELEAKAKESLKSGSRLVAKNHLKKRKMMESSIEKKCAQLNNIESIIEGVVSAESNKSVVESYRTGLDALRASLSSHNLDDVDELMGDIGETLSKGEGLSFMLARVPLDHSADLEELEKELEELEEVAPTPQGEPEEADLLAELERLAVHDSSLEPVILATGAGRGEGRGSPVAL